jgi:hypothetical protein
MKAKPIPFTTEELKQLFDYRDGELFWKVAPSRSVKIGARAGSKGEIYWKVNLKRCTYKLHRLIWLWHGNSLTEGLEIDHIDRNPSNNRIENLREVDRSTNGLNKQVKGVAKSGYHTKPWCAYSQQIRGKRVHIGWFKTEEEALLALESYKREHF